MGGLQEVVARPAAVAGHMAVLVAHGREDAELGIEIFVDRHDRSNVAAPITVVWCRPDSDHGLLSEMELREKRRECQPGLIQGAIREGGKKTYLVALVDQLVGTRDGLETIDVVELGGHLVPKEPACSARAASPRVDVFGLAPHEVADGALMRYLLRTRHDPDLVDGPNLGRQPAVDAEDGAVDDGGQDEEVKHLAAGLPHRGVAVLRLALLVEAVHLGDLAGLVITSN